VSFPVCVIDGDISSDVTLPNNHVHVLAGTVNIGNGGAMGSTEGNVQNVTLTIQEGAQVYAASEQQGAALVITRGSEIDANGTAALPIVFGAVDFDPNM